MTPEERAAALFKSIGILYWDEELWLRAVAAEIRKVVLEEREACAVTVDRYAVGESSRTVAQLLLLSRNLRTRPAP